MMSLVRASGEGGVVPAQKKCLGFGSPESAGAAGDAPRAPSAASAAARAMIARTPRANERADLTGLPPTGRCEGCRCLAPTAYPRAPKINLCAVPPDRVRRRRDRHGGRGPEAHTDRRDPREVVMARAGARAGLREGVGRAGFEPAALGLKVPCSTS